MPRSPRQPGHDGTPEGGIDDGTTEPQPVTSSRSRANRGSPRAGAGRPPEPSGPPKQDDPVGDSSPSAASEGLEPATDDAAAAGLSFRQAQAALELCLARLQDEDLDVEAMAGLYRRALAYSRRCEAVLLAVEQDVMQWDPERPDAPPESLVP